VVSVHNENRQSSITGSDLRKLLDVYEVMEVLERQEILNRADP
jgi:hypothetical protein